VSCDQNRLSTPPKVATNANALLRNHAGTPVLPVKCREAAGMNKQGTPPQESGKAIGLN